MKIPSALALFVSVFVSLAQAQTAPTIASLSDSRLLTQGEALSLSVSVNGTAPFTYVWKKVGTTISGATSSTYSISAVATTDAGSYTVTITNAAGSVTSGAILVDVTAAKAPVFDGQPGDVSVTIGDTINLSAWVSGTPPFTVEWKKGSTILTTGSSTYYSKANAQLADAGTYTIVVTNIAGTVTSSPFIVTVNALTAPAFYYGPYGGTVDEGDYFSMYAYVSNASGVTYQWYRDGVLIPGATNNAYGKSAAIASDAGSYTVVATNSAGSTTSLTAVIVVRPPSAPTNLSISSGPITVTVGESLNLYSSVSGNSPFTYQWLKDGVEIAGATNWVYYKSNVTADDTGSYSIVATNSVGSATSSGTSVAVSTAQVPIITYHPISTAVYPGDYLSLSVSATGTGTLSYQWKKDGVNIANATSGSLWLSSSAAASDAGSYIVVVTNSQGSAASTGASPLALGSKNAAILVSLAPGVYSAHVRGVGDTTGVALVEVYDVP